MELWTISENFSPFVGLHNINKSAYLKLKQVNKVFLAISTPSSFGIPSWRNFGDIVLKFCICCQLLSPDKSTNLKTVS